MKPRDGTPEPAQTADLVTADDYSAAITLLLAVPDHTGVLVPLATADPWLIVPAGARLRRQAAEHLDRKLEAQLRERMPIRTDEHAAVLVAELARSIQGAAKGLRWAAERLKKASDVHGANQTMQAALLLEQEAAGYLG